ncbi:site-specific integrase [Nocardia sp. NPDC004168]|uniref:site-specific integrase n=1 Tax=Nocardia sp. NPDC004168 TaxID=3154452 RepID=UPI0033A21EAB
MSAQQGAVAVARAEEVSITRGLWEAITPEFLDLIGWRPEQKTLRFPQEHPILGWRVCTVSGCQEREQSNGLCSACFYRWGQAGRPSIEHFRTIERVRSKNRRGGWCLVDGCRRHYWSTTTGLCTVHQAQQKRLGLPMAQFLADPSVVGLTSRGVCAVVSCFYDRRGRGPYCHVHDQRWNRLQRSGKSADIDEAQWRLTEPTVGTGGEVSLRGLPERVVGELLFGLQQRVAKCSKTPSHNFRRVCDQARTEQVSTVEDLTPQQMGEGQRKIVLCFLVSVRLLRSTPETERLKDEWDTAVFGFHGMLRFGAISQSWLREAAKRAAFHDMSRRRGRGVKDACQARISALARLSESLRMQRADGGIDLTVLSRSDVTAFEHRLRFLVSEGVISDSLRYNTVLWVRHWLRSMRVLGLTRPGEPLHGLAEDFSIAEFDLRGKPAEPDRHDKAGKDMPVEVMRHVCAHLDQFEELTNREFRVAVELLIDTGRRPYEICGLNLDCLERDGQGKPIMVFDNTKANRLGRRLPITEATAALISGQQQRVREQFPDDPASTLKLLPTILRNPHGRRPIQERALSVRHRDWMTILPDISVPMVVTVDGTPETTMVPFDKSKIFLYAYRHTYAQRHADAGVPADVLRELMDHRQLMTTQGYYRVGEQRRREAVERVTTMQFDRHGNRVWHHAKALLDSEHLRHAVGSVAVPYGTCSEPSNVAAGGDDCPVRFRCVGCAHFSTDVSYLPDLEAYLADLLRSRERLRGAFAAAEDWAKAEAMPSDNEITRIRRLISRIKADVEELSAEDRAQIQEAVGVVRRARNSVTVLGLPRIRQPHPDIRPDRSA